MNNTVQKYTRSHLCVSIIGLERQIDLNEGWQIFTDDKTGRFLTLPEVRQLIADCRKKGYKVIPTCDHVDKDGHCLGHAYMKKTIRYKKGDVSGRWVKEHTILRGWKVVEEKEVGGYSAGKGFILALIFLPLALFGFGQYIDVTYEK